MGRPSNVAVAAPALTLSDAVAQIAAGAAARDRTPGVPPFPREPFVALRAAGALVHRPALADQLALVRAVSAADGAVGRILDGHLNALERLAVYLPEVDPGDGLHGVWGADPGPGEGPPARMEGDVLTGVKTFCSGAGGLDRALVLTDGWLAYVDLSEGVRVDESWYRSAGLRASASHRVVFAGAPVLDVLGERGSIGEQPWFARDAVRTSATWAGLADAAAASALATLAAKPGTGELEALAAGRIETQRRTIGLWLAEAARLPRLDAAFAAHERDAVATACRTLLDEAVRACGSRPLVTADTLDRAKRDLDVFLLQHRLDPIVARAGQAMLEP